VATLLRKTGIRFVGDIPWGAHLCHFFQTKEDLLDVLVPYFQAGLEAGEMCLWVVAPPLSVAEAGAALRRATPDLDRHLVDGSLEIHPHSEWYLTRGVMDLPRAVRVWDETLDLALNRGFTGLRVNGSASWLQKEDWRDFSEYEEKVDEKIGGKKMMVLCTYPLATSEAAHVLDVARTHQFALAKRDGRWEMVETPRHRQAKDEIRRRNDELEQRVAERTAQLEAVNEAFQAIFDNIPVMISSYDAEGRLLSVNREWERTLGWTFEEAQALDILAECYPDPEHRRAVLDFIRRADRNWADFKTRTRDGRLIDTSWTRSQLSDGSRLGIGIDITERKRAEAALAEAEARFAKAFQASPVALAVSTIAEGRIIDVNERWLELFGYARAEVIGRTNAELALNVDPDFRPATVARVREEGIVRDLELQVRRKSGEIRDLMVSAVPIALAGEDECCISSHADITDRKRAEEERDRLLESERAARTEAEAALERLRAIESITDSALRHLGLDELLHELLARLQRALNTQAATVFLLSEDGQTLYPRTAEGYELDPALLVRVGYGATGLIAARGHPLIVDDYSRIDVSGIEGINESDLRAQVGAVMGVPLRIGNKVVGVVVVSSERSRRFTAEELGLMGLVADRVAPAVELARLVERVRGGRERQRVLARRLLTAQEEERRRLAVELHDELGQVLTAVKINLESLERMSGRAPAPAHLRDAIASVDQAMQRVRDLALDLRPSVLDDLGLAAALRWYVDRFARTTHLEVRVSVDPVPPLEPELETACFRVAQEALTNVARHARARRVWLDLKVLPEGVDLAVRDDGIGFDVRTARERAIGGASMGLLGMQERVSLVDGEFDVRSTPEGGTEVRARFALGGKDRPTT
jgi:PAS domain S-box-containing protein